MHIDFILESPFVILLSTKKQLLFNLLDNLYYAKKRLNETCQEESNGTAVNVNGDVSMGTGLNDTLMP
ncbi:MAG: hypothetical protein IKF83_02295 [Clostridia bacterium]|nr:hypothetical protein [Clostridia bacterium]